MVEVVGISFKEKGRIYYFSPNHYQLKKKITVIVQTDRGLQFGRVETDPFLISSEKLKAPLQKVLRIASKKDYQDHRKNLRDAKLAFIECKKLVNKNHLNMQIIDANYTFDRDQLMFHFVSETRVDFRVLAKELAALYKTRIELRQIGVRDKAKEIGGLGPCGIPLCCARFLKEFGSVSINMAKNQNLSLNPTKINGACGRLLCCLKYEDANYTSCKKCLPIIGSKVKTPHGEGTVVSIDILNHKYQVNVPDVGIIEVVAQCQ